MSRNISTVATFGTIYLSRPLSVCLESLFKTSNDVLFQTANVFLLMAFLSTNGIYGVLYLRVCLTIGCLLIWLWAWVVTCEADIIVWNVLFTTINAIHVIIIIWKLHPFVRFPHDVEMVYRNLFQPLKVSRNVFKQIYDCTREIQTLKPNDIYAIEGQTRVDRLTLLLSGRVSVIRNGKPLHILDSHQFLDSPEWFGVGTQETYEVSIVALEESRLMIWNRDKLKLSISCDLYLQSLIDNILGKDVVKKLLLVTDSVGNHNSAAGERTTLIIPNHRSMDLLIKRSQLNGNDTNVNCFWNLSRITESDAETCV
ncbi:popeye domain-containing protein 2-like [Oppia nitens]|uniref:popeye domain-containing protein 2-like n=1 Tax=Oppia nitens TaxID=1686743 RepID=UPI0023D9F0A0|nr:popeye domain-containing protein 2-like [Oppia nitens]